MDYEERDGGLKFWTSSPALFVLSVEGTFIFECVGRRSGGGRGWSAD